MAQKPPLVSIGVPVYEGENYLEAALDSMLGQTFSDFEIIISDNGSTDRTDEICRKYASRDTRIRHFTQPSNLGAAENYNFVFHQSRGEFFKWAAHDDICHPRFVERCLDVLRDSPDQVLAYPLHETIDADENVVKHGGSRPEASAEDVATRVEAALDPRGPGEPPWSVFGLMRRDALERTRLHGRYTGSDRTLMVELALLGPFAEIEERLFFNRDHLDRSIRPGRNQREGYHPRATWFDPSRSGRRVFPNWRRLRDLVTAVFRTDLSWKDRWGCWAVIARWIARGNWKRLIRDLWIAVIMTVRPGLRPQ